MTERIKTESLRQQLKLAEARAAMWQGLAEKLTDAVVALCERRAGRTPDNLLAAPCVFCGYEGADYWQPDTHIFPCPWHRMVGSEERRAALRGVIEGLGAQCAATYAFIADSIAAANPQSGITEERIAQMAFDLMNGQGGQALLTERDRLRQQVAALNAQLAAQAGVDLPEDHADDEPHLRCIREWSFTDCAGLMKLIVAHWDHAQGRITRDGDSVELITGGWSDNEAIMAALRENTMIWVTYWQESRRGGYFRLELPEQESGE